MVNLYSRQKFELRPPMPRKEKTKEECIKFWLDIIRRLKSGDPVTGDPRKFSFSPGYNTVESKIKYCNDMIYFINNGTRRPVVKKEKVKK